MLSGYQTEWNTMEHNYRIVYTIYLKFDLYPVIIQQLYLQWGCGVTPLDVFGASSPLPIITAPPITTPRHRPHIITTIATINNG